MFIVYGATEPPPSDACHTMQGGNIKVYNQWRRSVYNIGGTCSRPEGPRAGVGFLERGQPAPYPPARESGGAL